MTDTTAAGAALSAPHLIEFAYTRSLGPALGRFLGGLGQRVIVGSRSASGQVCVPPVEFDPDTLATIEDWVEVGSRGVVESWAWQGEAHPSTNTASPLEYPIEPPFAWALVKLKGADNSLLHVVQASSAQVMRTGLEVEAQWADEPSGSILDLRCFRPLETS